MDYKKLDAALAAALSGHLDGDEKSFEVFVQVERPLDESEKDILQQLGLKIDGQGTILTARLSAHDIDALSCRPSIRYMTLSQRLRPAK